MSETMKRVAYGMFAGIMFGLLASAWTIAHYITDKIAVMGPRWPMVALAVLVLGAPAFALWAAFED